MVGSTVAGGFSDSEVRRTRLSGEVSLKNRNKNIFNTGGARWSIFLFEI